MLNIEKYKEELENIGVLNPTELAVIDGKPCMCQEAECNMCELRSAEIGCFYRIIGYSPNTKNQKLVGRKSRLIHLYWLKTS